MKKYLIDKNLNVETKNDLFPEQDKKSKQIITQIMPFSPKQMTYGDQTRKFPFKSSRGNEYIMIMYDHDANAILAKPFKTRQAK